MRWQTHADDGPHEAHFLKLDCSKIKTELGWKPRWHIRDAVDQTVAWAKAWESGADMRAVTEEQIDTFFA